MEQETINILEKLFLTRVNAQKFRAKNYKNIDRLDELENSRYIEIANDHYRVTLAPLLELSKTVREAEHILFLCELVFKQLHSLYLERAGEAIGLNELAEKADLPRSDINKSLSYMIQSQIFGGYTTKFYSAEDAQVTPGERILRFNSFTEVVEDIIKMQSPSKSLDLPISSLFDEENPFAQHHYVNQSRINSLEILRSENFDFSRLIQICNEINHCASNENYIALGALVRILLDHIPPIFKMKTFKEVASNYKAGKSLKGSLKNLENSSRNISDGLLHQVIRKQESVPTLNQVNFSPDIDVLIGEIIRVIEENA